VSYTYIGDTDDYSIPLGFIVALRVCARSLRSRVVSLRTFLLNAMTDGAAKRIPPRAPSFLAFVRVIVFNS